MTKHVKIVPIGNSYGVVIPDELMQRLNLQPGDTLPLSEDGDAIELRNDTAEFDRQMAIARDIMQRNWNVLRALAK